MGRRRLLRDLRLGWGIFEGNVPESLNVIIGIGNKMSIS